MSKPFDLSEVRYVKRVIIGNNGQSTPGTEAEANNGEALLNRCLSEPPRGHIMGMEKSFTLLTMGEHQIVVQWLVYHVGFRRKPAWLDEPAG